MELIPIKLIAGLGNPGDKYKETRHNAGFLFVDRLLHRFGGELRADKHLFGRSTLISIAGKNLRIMQPDTYMNESGRSVGAALSYYKIDRSELLVVHDEIDLDPGIVRLKTAGGHGGNNGLRDIIQHLGSGDFCRLRLGVGHPGTARDVANYVLRKANKSEQQLIDQSIEESIDVMELILRGDISEAMNQLHRRSTE